MSAIPPPTAPPIPGSAPRSSDPLAVVSVVLAIAAALLALVSGPISLWVQLRLGAPVSWIGLVLGLPVLAVGVAALIVGLVGLARRGARRAMAGAGAGLGGFLAIGQVVGLLTLLVLNMAR